MQKFFLMIFTVSLFFIGIGGFVRQIENYFLPTDVLFTSFNEENDQKIRFVNEIQPTINERHKVIFENKRIELPNGDFQIKVPAPPEMPKGIEPNFEFERLESEGPLKKGESFPRLPSKNLIIIKRGAGGSENEDLKVLTEEKILIPTVKVLNEQETQTK